MAKRFGYEKIYELDKLEKLLIELEGVMRQTGPAFARVKGFREGEPSPYPERSMAQGWAEVRETLSVEDNGSP